MEDQQRNRFLIFVAVMTLGLAVLFFIQNNKLNTAAKIEADREIKITTDIGNLPLEAKSISVYNITLNKEIFGLNNQTPLPIASLAKTMTVLVSLNNHKINDEINIPKSAISQIGDYGIFQGEKWYMSDLAKGTLIASSNDGAYALAVNDPQFVDKMNALAKKLGMINTLFESPTGLDIDLINPGGVTSASDANTMAMFALREFPQIFYVTTLPELKIVSNSNISHLFKNTDQDIGKIPNLLFSKTGFTKTAGGNLSVIFKNSREEEIAVTLLGSSYDGRFTDMEKIVNVLYSN